MSSSGYPPRNPPTFGPLPEYARMPNRSTSRFHDTHDVIPITALSRSDAVVGLLDREAVGVDASAGHRQVIWECLWRSRCGPAGKRWWLTASFKPLRR